MRQMYMKFIIAILAVTSFQRAVSARDLWIGERNHETVSGKVTDQFGEPMQARVELWYADIGLIEEELGEALPMSEQYQRNLFHAGYANEEGWFHVTAVAGSWLLRVSKGPEYEIFEMPIEISDGELDGQRINVVLEQLYDLESMGWYSGDLHHHSVHSDGRQSPDQIYDAMVGNDIDFAALTDHNQLRGNDVWVDYNESEFLAIPGLEVTTSAEPEVASSGKGWGHMNAIGVSRLVGATDPSNPVIGHRYLFHGVEDQQRAINETHVDGGIYQLSHSCWSMDWPDGTISTWGSLKDYDAISVFVGWDVGPHMPTVLASEYGPSIFGTAQWNMNTMATQVWFEMLNAGNRVAGWASSDSHDVTSLQHTGAGAPVYWRNTSGNARTYVHSRKLEWNAVRKALKDGRAFVTAGFWGPLLLVNSRNAEPGDEVRIGPRGWVPLHIQVLSNRPLAGYAEGIRIIVGGEVVKTLPTVDGQMTVDVDTRIRVNPRKDTWVVVQVFGDWPSMAMTNPIYLKSPYTGWKAWGSTEWRFPEGAAEWFNPFPNHPEVTIPDGPSLPPVPIAEVVEGEYRQTY